MGDFFKPWRRKIGMLTLVMACVFCVLWIRGVVVADIFSLSGELKSVQHKLLTSRYGLEWLRFELCDGEIGSRFGWRTFPIPDDD